MKVHEMINEADSEHWLYLSLLDFNFEKVAKQYKEMRTFMAITAEKDKFTASQLQHRIAIIDDYQDKLDTIRQMIISDDSEVSIKLLHLKIWAIEKYNNFLIERKRLML